MHDDLRQRIGTLFGFSDALAAGRAQLEEEQRADTARAEQEEQKTHRVRWEQESEKFYRAEEGLTKAAHAAETAEHHYESLKKQREAAEIRVKACAGARYAEKIADAEHEIAALQAEIRQREQGSDSADRMAALKYSAYCGIAAERDALRAQLHERQTERRQTEQALAESREKRDSASAEREKARSAYDQKCGELRLAKRTTDDAMGKLRAELTRKLDGVYAAAEVQAHSAELQRQDRKLQEEERSVQRTIADAETALGEIPDQRAEQNIKRAGYEQAARQLETELREYHRREAQVEAICSQHNLAFSKRFSGEIRDYLTRLQRENEAECSEIGRKIAVTETAIQAAERGTVHVPQAVTAYLDAAGIRYITCEKYLINLTEQGKITCARCLKILEHLPEVAFGIVMDAEERARLDAFERDRWLPALVPLFSHKEMDGVLQNMVERREALAFYAQDYFSDRQHYRAHLEQERHKLQTQLTLRQERVAATKTQLAEVESFLYTESFLTETQERLAALQGKISSCAHAMEQLKARETTLKAEKERGLRQGEQLHVEMQAIAAQVSVCETILDLLGVEDELYNARSALHDGLKAAERNDAAAQRAEKQLQQACEQMIVHEKGLQESIDKLKPAEREVADCAPAERLSGPWQQLLEEYRAQSQAFGDLQKQMEGCMRRRQEYEEEIARLRLEPQQYAGLQYRKEDEASAVAAAAELKQQCDAAEPEMTRAVSVRARAEAVQAAAKAALDLFGPPLDKHEIGGAFEKRLTDIAEEKRRIQTRQDQRSRRQQEFAGAWARLEDLLEPLGRPAYVPAVALQEPIHQQHKQLLQALREGDAQFESAAARVGAQLQTMKQAFPATGYGISESIGEMIALKERPTDGDQLFTLVEQIDGAMQNAQRAVSQIDTDLKEFANARTDLIRQCRLQGQRIYEGLQQMAASSKVEVYEGRPRQQMIRFDMPNEVDDAVAAAAIEAEIDCGTTELCAKTEGGAEKTEMKNAAEQIVGNRTLLRKYIGKEAIEVSAFKIDQNPKNGGYRTWKQTRINSSGAEKFVVYFAVILSLMNYSRSDLGEIRDRELRSTLILDNPFGKTSSRHILKPMFAIAHHFRVQLICLSDINKSDVLRCFSLVIQAVVKQRPMSGNELLTHEGNERIEHGFYCVEDGQISLL